MTANEASATRRVFSAVVGAWIFLQPAPAISATDDAESILKSFGVAGLPPVSPAQDETAVQADGRQFNALFECYSKFNDPKAGKLGPAHVTNSPKWGYLLRADFVRNGESTPAFRLLCWNGGFQTLRNPPLPALDAVPN
ncbi:MAG TPA: hypothetical protein VFW28_17170 [Micropepsaceae bacterium]|nr:hypothetical protein [Micropepsaceae bacterium]